jgi:hypothetical protein
MYQFARRHETKDGNLNHKKSGRFSQAPRTSLKKGSLFNANNYVQTNHDPRPSIFRDVTQRLLAVIYRRFGQPIGP